MSMTGGPPALSGRLSCSGFIRARVRCLSRWLTWDGPVRPTCLTCCVCLLARAGDAGAAGLVCCVPGLLAWDCEGLVCSALLACVGAGVVHRVARLDPYRHESHPALAWGALPGKLARCCVWLLIGVFTAGPSSCCAPTVLAGRLSLPVPGGWLWWLNSFVLGGCDQNLA